MVRYSYENDAVFALNTNRALPRQENAVVYEIMHMEKTVASISTYGDAEIYLPQFMPLTCFWRKAMILTQKPTTSPNSSIGAPPAF